MTSQSQPVRVRVAPSPTGDPHVGTAYMALFNYAFARKHGGQLILRIDDTDRTRYREGSEAAIMRTLRWLGLEWDEGPDKGGPHGPYRQSERTALYREHALALVATGRAYRCFLTEDELERMRVERRESKTQEGFRSPYRDADPKEGARRAETGESHVIRLKMPAEGATVFVDRLRGQLEIDNGQSDDQILLKSDGFPTYHLATVVDDHLMGITHIVRAEEWISSTPKHAVMYDSFGWPRPEWIHMPLLRNPDKSKISKRKNPVSLDYYIDAGILPEAMRNFLGIMGWSFGDDREKFTLQEMVDAFDWSRVSLGGPVFDQDKLRWMNEQYLKELSDEQLADALLGWRLRRDHLVRIAPLIRERIKRLDEFIPATEYFFSGDLDPATYADKLVIPDVAPKDLRKALLELLDRYEELPEFADAALEETSRQWCEARGWKPGKAFMVLRWAVTGRKASPPLFATMEVLGKELTRRRLRLAVELIGKPK